MSIKPNVLRSISRSGPYICWQCQQRRHITQNFLKKKEEGRQEWATQAKEIRAGGKQSMLSVLKERGYIHAIAGEEKAVDQLMIDKRVGVYCGVDPTARSLHVGHMVTFMALFQMFIRGFHTVSLIGGSTSGIGDPTGRTTDRPELTSTERKANITSIHYQLKRIWLHVERKSPQYGFSWDKHWHRELENNAIWLNKTAFVEVLKVLGRGIRLGPMLSRDTVKNKMASGDGMSFAEFCYPLLQAWDWWHMYNTKGIQMQIGGADQFGNIVAGIDAIKYIAKTHPDPDVRQQDGVNALTTPYGFTVPLLTTASGEKFGKSAGNAIWLDADMTSIFDLYGFFVRTADADVERYLKLLTFLPLSEIQSLMDQHKVDPGKRIPQHRLAHEFVDLVHGKQEAVKAENEHRALFSKPSLASLKSTMSAADPPAVVKPNPLLSNQNAQKRIDGTYLSTRLNPYAPQVNASNSPAEHIILPKSLVYNQPVARILYAAKVVTSRGEGHRLASAGGVYVGRQGGDKGAMRDDLSYMPFKSADPMMAWKYLIREQGPDTNKMDGEEGLLILRVGKWKVRMVRVVTDEKYDSLMLPPSPMWEEYKAQMAAEKNRGLHEGTSKSASLDHEPIDAGTRLRSTVEGKTLAELEEEDLNPPASKSIWPTPTPFRNTPTPVSKGKQQRNELAVSQVRGRLSFETLRLKKLNEAAKAAGYRAQEQGGEQDRDDTFMAAQLQMQEQLVKRLSIELGQKMEKTDPSDAADEKKPVWRFSASDGNEEHAATAARTTDRVKHADVRGDALERFREVLKKPETSMLSPDKTPFSKMVFSDNASHDEESSTDRFANVMAKFSANSDKTTSLPPKIRKHALPEDSPTVIASSADSKAFRFGRSSTLKEAPFRPTNWPSAALPITPYESNHPLDEARSRSAGRLRSENRSSPRGLTGRGSSDGVGDNIRVLDEPPLSRLEVEKQRVLDERKSRSDAMASAGQETSNATSDRTPRNAHPVRTIERKKDMASRPHDRTRKSPPAPPQEFFKERGRLKNELARIEEGNVVKAPKGSSSTTTDRTSETPSQPRSTFNPRSSTPPSIYSPSSTFSRLDPRLSSPPISTATPSRRPASSTREEFKSNQADSEKPKERPPKPPKVLAPWQVKMNKRMESKERLVSRVKVGQTSGERS